MKRHNAQKWVLGLLLVGGGCWTLLHFIPTLIDKNALKTAIEQGLRESTGVRFHIQELVLEPTLFHQLQVHLNTNTITDDNHHPLGDIRNISIEIRYWPLLFEQLPEIAKIHLNHVYIPIRDYSLFRSLRIQRVPPKQTGFLKPAALRDTEVLLTDYRIEDFKPEQTARTLMGGTNRVRMGGREFSIHHLESRQPIVLLGNGKLDFYNDRKSSKHPFWQGNYHFQASLLAGAFNEGHTMSAADVQSLLLTLKGSKVDLHAEYKQKPRHQSGGKIRARTMHLPYAQAIALQLSNMFSIQSPLPLRQFRLAGDLSANGDFRMDFDKKPQPFEMLAGRIRLMNMGLSANGDIFIPRIQDINGQLLLNGDVLKTSQAVSFATLPNTPLTDRDSLRFKVGHLPFRLRGIYRLSDGKVNATLQGKDLHIASLKTFASDVGLSPAMLQGRRLEGDLALVAHLQGTSRFPVYSGDMQLKNGAIEEPSLGIYLDRLNAQLQVKGAGFQTPHLKYSGRIALERGRLLSPKNDWAIRSVDGKADFRGEWIARSGSTPPIPEYNGLFRFRDGEARIPESTLRATGIQGVLRLDPKRFRLQDARLQLANQTIQAEGESSPDFKRYQAHVWGRNLSLPLLMQTATAHVPRAGQTPLSRIRVERGSANLDMFVSTGLEVRGRADVTALSVRMPPSRQSLKAPRLLLSFNNHGATLAPATLYYGPIPTESGHAENIALHASGSLALRQGKPNYNLRLASEQMPLSLLRDLQANTPILREASIPEIWNTAGRCDFAAALSNRATQLAVAFQDAGISWKGGDFPVSDLNGALFLALSPNGKLEINTQDLHFVYGNSPIRLSAQNAQQLSLLAEGTLSALTVNHFLVSPQSNATPYRDIPFRIQAAGTLGNPFDAIAGREAMENDIRMALYLDLNHTLKGVSEESAQPEAEPTTATAVATPQGLSLGERMSQRNNSTSPSPLNLNLNPVRLLKTTVSQTTRLLTRSVSTLTHAVQQLARPQRIAKPLPVTPAPVASAEVLTAPEVLQLQGIHDGQNAYLDVGLHWSKGDISLERGILHLFDAGDILANGMVARPFEAPQRSSQLHVWTPSPVRLSALASATDNVGLFRQASGSFSTDVQLLNNLTLPSELTGWLATDRIALPELQVDNVTGRVDLTGRGALVEIDTLEIPGVKTSASARTDSLFESPVTLEDVNIQASELDIAGLAEFNNRIIKPVIIDRLVHNYLRPWQLGDPYVPIQFRNGNLQSDEVVYQNILLNDLQSRLSVYANGFYELNDTHLEAAGGEAFGYLSMNPNDNSFTTLDLNVRNVKANALTKALLNVTNQIFGDLSGNVRFTTFGNSDDEMQRNANGTVSIRVQNGRLPAIGKVETLLTTANLIRGGILGLNLNNLLRTLTIYDTNYFAELSGDMLINNQVLYTRNLMSDGVNLDLLIRGNLRMDNGDADMVVNGRMSQNVAGRLGFLGQLSLGQILRLIPALGTMGKSQAGLFGYLPGIGYIPGFGGPAGSSNRFQVRLKGALDDPSSIRDFHWVHSNSPR